jgi:nitrogen regulatory protein PII
MKKLETVITERVFQTVRDLLVAEGRDVVVSEVRAYHERGHTLNYRGIAYHGYESRLKIETVVSDSEAMSVVHAILTASRGLDSTDHGVAVSQIEHVQSIGITKLDSQRGSAAPPTLKNTRTPLPETSRYRRAV